VLNPTGDLRVMIAMSFSKVVGLKLGCFMKEEGSMLQCKEDISKKGKTYLNTKSLHYPSNMF